MEEQRTDIIFYRELTPERRAEIQAAMREAPAWAPAFTRWQQVRAAVRRQMNAHIPDRRLLVLYALDAAGHGAALSAEERATLDAARAAIDDARAQHPGLDTVIDRIQDDQVAFAAAWDAHVEPAADGAASHAAAPAAEKARADRAPRPSPAQRASSAQRRWGWRAAALAFVAVLAMVSVLVFTEGDGTTVVATGPEEVQQLTLADGSTVRLMGASRLAYTPPAGDAAFDRTVTLEQGRAFFDVASAPRSFVVETPSARTTALGTSFGVDVREGDTQVVLASGRVEVAARSDAERAVTLQPGQASRVAAGGAPSAPSRVDVAETLAWTGLFIFRDTPVATIVDRLAQHYGTPVMAAPALQDEAVTGTFERQRPLDQVLATMAATLDAEVTRTADGYRLAPRGTP